MGASRRSEVASDVNAVFDADVAIVGGGPVGTMLAILLGRQGRNVILTERWETAYGRPRAVTYDHEIARILATLGIDSEDDPAITHYDELYYWKNAAGEDIQIVDWQSKSASGWRVRYWFNQPDLEARLTGIAETLPSVRIWRGWEAVGLEQDADGATLTLAANHRDPGDSTPAQADAERRTVRARYVVGSDGANSFVREALGIESEDLGYFFDWLILDMIPSADYAITPAQWQLCDPRRPTTIVGGGPGRRRWEYMLLPGEQAAEMASPAKAWELLEPWGITPANAELERSAVYRFQARWAKVWNVGRCMIAGDAAHLMPPFAGEGMCAGLRDAVALGWRLNALLDGQMGPEVLDSYTSERIPHVRHYIDFSQELGSIICITDEEAARQRDAAMRADLEARNFTPVPTDKCRLGEGGWCLQSPHGGELSVQGVVDVDGRRDRFDQAVGHGWILIGLGEDPAAALGEERLALFERLGGRAVRMGAVGEAGVDAVDVEGTYAAWLGELGARFVVLRPDFYVALVADSAQLLRARFDTVFSSLHVAGAQRTLAA